MTKFKKLTQYLLFILLILTFIPAIVTYADTKDDLYAQAAREYEADNLPKAKKLFYRFFATYPEDIKAPFALYYFIHSLKDINQIVRFTDYLSKKYPDFKKLNELLMKSAEIFFGKEDYGRAKAFYIKVIRNNPSIEKKISAIYHLGKIALLLGNRKIARKYFVYLVNAHSDNEYVDSAYYEIGETYFSEGNYKKATHYYTYIVDHFDNSELMPKALYRLSRCYEFLKLDNLALQTYKVLIKNYPKSFEAKISKKALSGMREKFLETGIEVKTNQPMGELELYELNQAYNKSKKFVYDDSGTPKEPVHYHKYRNNKTIEFDLPVPEYEPDRPEIYKFEEEENNPNAEFYKGLGPKLRYSDDIEVPDENLNYTPVKPFRPNKRETVKVIAKKVGGYYIQVGVFSNKANAFSFKKELSSLGYSNTAVIKSKVNGKIMYKTAIVGIKTYSNAKKVSDNLKNRGYNNMIVEAKNLIDR